MRLLILPLLLLSLFSCSSTNSLDSESPIAKIEHTTVYFSDGKSASLPMSDETTTVLYLVRHAEKAASGGSDPALTEEGIKRADRLRTILTNAGLTGVYSTDYQRTRATAQPSAEQADRFLQIYDPGNLAAFAEKIKVVEYPERFLIVGHSNTTPALVNTLLGEEKFAAIDESDYSNFFVMVINQNGEVVARKLKF